MEQGNIIPTLISYIKKPALFDARTPCYFCTIIVKLSYNDDYKQRLVSGGCIAAVKQFIQNNIKRPELSACGCSALDCLSKKGTASKKSSFAGSPGVNNYFFLLKTNKYDRETYASIFEAMAIVISANREKARVVTQNGGIQILTNVAMRFVDSSTSTNRVVFSGFIALMDVILRSLIEIKELRSLEDNAKPLFTLFYRAVKEFAESANELHMASFILYALTESFPQGIS